MMSRESLKERRCLILVEEMTHYAEIFTSIVAGASDKTLDLAASGPTHRRGRLGYGPSVNVRKDNCDPLLPAISKLRDTLKHIRRGKEGERSRRHQLKCHGDMSITHS